MFTNLSTHLIFFFVFIVAAILVCCIKPLLKYSRRVILQIPIRYFYEFHLIIAVAFFVSSRASEAEWH